MPRSSSQIFRCNCTDDETGEKCQESFSRKGLRDQHIESTHGLVPCIQQCCGLGFPTRELMMAHMSELPNHAHLVCRVCFSYATDMPSNVLRHIIANHPEHLTPEERAKFECPVCLQPFVHLHRHYAMRHPELLPQNVRHRFWCTTCEKYFVNLGLHISNVHKKPFPCPVVSCQHIAGRISDLKKHLRGPHRYSLEHTEDILDEIRQKHAERTGRTVIRQVRPANRNRKDEVPAMPRDVKMEDCALDSLFAALAEEGANMAPIAC